MTDASHDFHLIDIVTSLVIILFWLLYLLYEDEFCDAIPVEIVIINSATRFFLAKMKYNNLFCASGMIGTN